VTLGRFQAARVSTSDVALKGDIKDEKLIRYLMRHMHRTPFEKLVFEFHVKCPIFVGREWMRHRMASYNEKSARYQKFKDWEWYQPSEWRIQAQKNKQSSVPSSTDMADYDKPYNKILQNSEEFYKDALDNDVAREMARLVMPVSVYTEFFVTMNFNALMNFLTLRMDEGAQWEIRQYANAIFNMLKNIESIQWTVGAFNDFVLSKPDVDSELLSDLHEKLNTQAKEVAVSKENFKKLVDAYQYLEMKYGK